MDEREANMNQYREVKSASGGTAITGKLGPAETSGVAAGVEELARWNVGRRTFVAERVVVNGNACSRIRIDGTDEMMDYFDRRDSRGHADAFSRNSALADWLPGRTPARKA